MARRFLTLLFAFAAMVLGIEGLRRAADFFALLAEQSRHVEHTVALLVRYMETGDDALG